MGDRARGPGRHGCTRARVLYQGYPGAFSELAIRAIFRSPVAARGLPCFRQVASALSSRRADYALVPVENAIAGPVAAATCVLEAEGVRTWAEIVMPVRQCLLARPGAAVDAITRVFSHPVALDQCGCFLRVHGLQGVAVEDTAGAARLVAGLGSAPVAAIASRAAARHHGLVVLAAGVEDRDGNWTRFVLVGTPETPPPDVWKALRC